MGACLGRCFAKVTDTFSYRSYQRHTGMSLHGDDDDTELKQSMEEERGTKRSNESKNLLSFLSLRQFKKRHGVPVTLELMEEGGWRISSKYARLSSRNTASTSSGLDTSMRTLDARSLIKQQGCISSTPGSSLDLEWEHEGMPLPEDEPRDIESPDDASITQTSVNNSQPSSLTASPWSRVSTPNSLEWDPVEAEMVCVDIETEQLLTEIERLTDRALKETGEWTGSS